MGWKSCYIIALRNNLKLCVRSWLLRHYIKYRNRNKKNLKIYYDFETDKIGIHTLCPMIIIIVIIARTHLLHLVLLNVLCMS